MFLLLLLLLADSRALVKRHPPKKKHLQRSRDSESRNSDLPASLCDCVSAKRVMAPTLSQANARKWWIAVTSVLENLMFAAVLLGWSSLLLMLKNEGFYSNACKVDLQAGDNGTSQSGNETSSTANSSDSESDIKYTPSGYPTCAAQDEILNRYFSIGSSLLSGVTVILGVIMDKYGSRMIRLCGTLTFMLSCVLFAIGSLDTDNLSVLMAPAVCLNGMGGVVYIFTSFPVPNLFENLRSTMISLMIGSYSASAIMYMLFKAAYDAGVPFQAIMIFHASVAFLTFLNCYFNTPGEPIPGPDDISYAIKLRFGAMNFDHKVTGKKFLNHTSSVGRRMSSIDIAPSERHDYLESVIDISGNKSGPEQSFLQVLRSPCLLWSFVTMCLTQLRLIAYMGWLELYLRSSAEQLELDDETAVETVEFYTLLFGLLQMNCFFMAPIIGTIMDWNLKEKKKKKSKEPLDSADSSPTLSNGDATRNHTASNGHAGNGLANGHAPAILSEAEKQYKRKKQQVSNLARAFMLTNVLLTLFGVIVLFEKILPLQIVAFVAHTAIRTFLHSSVGGLYACMYHFSYFGKLTGLVSFLSAMAILVQDPLFVLINTSLGGDPFWVNFALLISTVLGFGLPIYLWRYGRNLKPPPREHAQEREMFTINEDEEQEDGFAVDISQRLRLDEPAVHVSSMALAL